MANDFSQEQQPTEEQLNEQYFPLVREEDIPEEVSDEEMNHFFYPKKQISNIGLGWLALSRVRPDNPELQEYDGMVTVIEPKGIRRMKEKESVNLGYYIIYIEIENPLIRLRDADSRVNMLTKNGPNIYAADLFNQSEDHEDFLKDKG